MLRHDNHEARRATQPGPRAAMLRDHQWCANIRCVRTTLSIADDILLVAKERARREHRSVGEIISELARHALTQSAAPPASRSDSFLGFEPLPHRGRFVSNALVDELLDEPLDGSTE